ncbi:ADP-ribosylglycohydrolase family protein, partial [Streptomyces sp. NPDC058418]|uniref:ADP-ribosylglycohydrolase family protein n=1 Tax=Streptomyces sp. NPDC058418 TaxID=3346488 RepID=UPI00365EF516
MDDRDRAVGAVVGSAVGDALGAPFEFGPEGAFSARFPRPGGGGEMCGGGGWDPGEATDDTQMAVLVAESRGVRGGGEPAPRVEPVERSAGAPHP